MGVKRGRCAVCGAKVALTKRGTVKAHGQARYSHAFAAGMVCTGTGKGPREVSS